MMQFNPLTDFRKEKALFKKLLFLTFLLIIIAFEGVYSQNRLNNFGITLNAGTTIGSPIIIKNIPEGATGQPGVGLNIGMEFSYLLHPKFSVSIGGAYAQKGSSFATPIEGKYDVARGVFGQRFPFPVKVNYTGNVRANFKMTFVDFPLLATIHLKKWRLGVGNQYSKMLDGTLDGLVDVKALFLKFNDQSFDRSNNIKEEDHAILAKIAYQLANRLSLSTNFSVSTQRLLLEQEEGFSNPRNVFATVLIGFRLF
jgi:hypothetical protein